MINKKIIVYTLLVVIFFVVLCKNTTHIKEHIIDEYDNTIVSVPIYRYIQPWWNSTRHTRNMSYDIRGDAHNPISYMGLWNISPLL